jgi:hypothetical protein
MVPRTRIGYLGRRSRDCYQMSNSSWQRPKHFADHQSWARSVIVKLLRVARVHQLARKINVARADFLRYIDALGLTRGAAAFFQIKRARPGSLVRVGIPGSKTPMQLRAGTEDIIVFQQVFLNASTILPWQFTPSLSSMAARTLDARPVSSRASTRMRSSWRSSPSPRILDC